MGRAAKERRGALQVKQSDLVRPGLSADTIGKIERGEPDGQAFRPNTLATMSRALRWSAGTLQAIAEGGDIPVDLGGDVERRLDLVEAEISALRSDQEEFRRLLEQLVRLGSQGLAQERDLQ